jgi:hypothetical protein
MFSLSSASSAAPSSVPSAPAGDDDPVTHAAWSFLYQNEAVNGVTARLLKSAIQKMARRRMSLDGLKAVTLLDTVSRHIVRGDTASAAAKKQSTKAKSIQTNTINRLIATMSEEVNIHEADLPVLFQSLYARWTALRATANVMGARRLLWRMYALLCDARKSRVVSDLKSKYCLPPYYTDTIEQQLRIADQCLAEFGMERVSRLRRLIAHQVKSPGALCDRIAASIRALAARGAKEGAPTFAAPALAAASCSSSSSCSESMAADEEDNLWCSVSVYFERDHSAASLWEILLALSTCVRARDAATVARVQSLRFFHKQMTHREQPIYLYHAVLLIVHAGACDTAIEDTGVGVDVEQLLSDPRLTVELPDFCRDIHTGARDKDRVTFAEEGALVVDEDRRFMNPVSRQMYVRTKALLEQQAAAGKPNKVAKISAAASASTLAAFSATSVKSHAIPHGDNGVDNDNEDDEDQGARLRRKLPAAASLSSSSSVCMCGDASASASSVASSHDIIGLISDEDDQDGRGSAAVASAATATSMPREIPIESISDEQLQHILSLPHGQKRCGHHKKAVLVDRDVVYKGPYRAAETSYKLNVTRPRQLLILERVYCRIPDTALEWRRIVCTPRNELYLVMENVGRAPCAADWTVESSKIESDVPILRRGGVVDRFSEVELTPRATDADRARVLEHLYVCYLLNVGDHGSHNVLFTPTRADGRVLGIDLEEVRADKKPASAASSPLSYLFKVVSKAQHAVYTPVLPLMRYARYAFAVEQLAADMQIAVAEARLIEQRRAHFAAVMSKAQASLSPSAGIASFFANPQARK